MRSITPSAYTAGFTFSECITRVAAPTKRRLEAAVSEVEAASHKYAKAAAAGLVHSLKPRSFSSGAVSDAQMQLTYTGRMVPDKSPGRWIYDELKLLAPDRICPLCGQGTVATLDHYLPKNRFPLLAVAPLNLVPACSDCNHAKLDSVATRAEDVPLNPYFDDVEIGTWLWATVIEKAPASVTFAAIPPETWDPVLAARTRKHFKDLHLAAMYTSRAGAELRDIRLAVQRAHARGGAAAVREQLLDQADSRRDSYLNSWATALYTALTQSDWYCRGGFAA
jgi:hypothetical protein